MRRTIIALTLALVPAIASAATLVVSLDHSVRMTLGGPAQDVIVGNPDIADVTVADPRHLVITGKKLGITNLIVTNTAGRTIFNRELMVSTAEGERVSVYEGGPVPIDYACSPRCAVDVDKLAGTMSLLTGSMHGMSTSGGAGAPAAPQPGSGAIQASPNLP